MSSKNIPYEVIVAAHAGEDEALRCVLKHYKKQIDFAARRMLYDEYGNRYDYIDQDIRQNIETMLIQQIITKFDPASLPSQ